MLNLEYVYDFQKERYEYFWEQNLECREYLSEIEVNDATLLPFKQSNKFLGDGGALDCNGNLLEESFMWGYNNAIYLGGKYETDKNIPFYKGQYVYLGALLNHWGHFLVDYSTRLYSIYNHDNCKYIFLLPYKAKNYKMPVAIERFFQLLGLKLDNT